MHPYHVQMMQAGYYRVEIVAKINQAYHFIHTDRLEAIDHPKVSARCSKEATCLKVAAEG